MEPCGIPLNRCSRVADPSTVLTPNAFTVIAWPHLAGDPVDMLQSAYDH